MNCLFSWVKASNPDFVIATTHGRRLPPSRIVMYLLFEEWFLALVTGLQGTKPKLRESPLTSISLSSSEDRLISQQLKGGVIDV